MDTWRVEEIWERTRGEGVTVAVIDSGVDDSVTPELAGQVLEGTDLTYQQDGAHYDSHGHGTLMASLIAGTGADAGLRGLAPGAEILPVRVTVGGSLLDFGEEGRMARGIEYAVEAGAQVISISLAGDEIGDDEEIVRAALAEAARQDVLIFAGAGNDAEGENGPLFPANREGVVGVGAVDRNGDHTRYSNYGPQVAMVAPGDDVPAYCPERHGDPCLVEEGGTSISTALASASAALIRSAYPDWTKNQVLRAMMETADAPESGERDDYVGYGMVRPDRVILDGGIDPGDPDTNPLFPTYEALLDPPVSPEPEPDPEPSEPATEPRRDVPDAAGSQAAGDGDGDGDGPWLLIGAGAVVLVGGVLTAVILGRRRRA